ncbi:adenosylmethionine decarboxylase [Sphingomonas gei]|uniref:Adenosylmethionine decarboxylase n=1 Tax=Sphingomonas gei TaxID=1395960 RepID=A0A4S1XDI0_9SPHN|nr:adenosylmethionine decarboxylase [Sphingomonas gei]TGX53520.1 adenosylmethionine decarboxylase [Sphingomonas gei]
MIEAYQGQHLIADLSGGTRLDDVGNIERCLIHAAAAAGATLLQVRLHSFGSGQGVTGVAMLAESHISIHTWPEYSSACVDIFMCGRSHDLDAALDAIMQCLGGQIRRRTLLTRSIV